MALLLRYAIRSHVGLIREGNEDSGYAGPRLLAIADGMGGAAAGELASAVVMATVARLDQAGGPDPQTLGGATEQTLQISQHDLAAMEAGVSPPDQPGLAEPDLALLGGAVVAANERLRAIVAERPELEGMGTTLTAMLWSGGRFGMVHVGDSRAYRLRDGLLEQMTADHTWVQRLIDEGRITEEEAGHHPQRSLLMRVLDGRSQVEADIGTFDAHSGDRYLLCSDGLSGFVSQETLAETLAAYPDPQQAVDALIELALRAGGPDNITCIVADTLDDGGSAGAGPNEATQMLGSVTPVVVGAASEGVDRLPRFTSAQPAPPPPDDFGQNNPAGRAARLRNRRGAPVPAAAPAAAPAAPPAAAPAAAPPQAAPAPHPGAVATDAGGYVDPSAVTAELETVPGQRGEPPSRRRPGGGPPPGAPATAAHPERKPRGRKGLVITTVTVIVLAGAATGAYLYSRGQYYTTAEADGQGGQKVVLYQGMTELSFVSQRIATPELPVRQIPLAMRGDATVTRTYSSEGEAKSYLTTVRTAVDTCVNYWKTQATAGAAGGTPVTPSPTTPASSAPPAVKSGDDIPSGAATGAVGTSNNGGDALPSTSPGDASQSSDLQSPGSSDTGALAPSASAPTTSPEPQKELAQYCAGTNG